MPALRVLLGSSGFQIVENLPALPERQLEITRSPLALSRAGLEGSEQVLEGVFFVLEFRCEVFETALRKKRSQTFRRLVACDFSNVCSACLTLKSC